MISLIPLETTPASMRAPRPLRALLVDDADLVRFHLRLLLEPLPGLVIAGEATDVPDAIRAFQQTRPDLVVLDLQMPSGSGVEVLQYIRASGSRCTVIILSGAMSPTLDALCRQAGADHCLHKATDFERVRDVVIELTA
jgi:DNA-binding NarL/FixJ family response regulator